MFYSVNVKAQNTYDTYFNPPCAYLANNIDDGSPIIGSTNPYIGEYQIFLKNYGGPYGHLKE